MYVSVSMCACCTCFMRAHVPIKKERTKKEKKFTKYATVVTSCECERLCAKYSSTLPPRSKYNDCMPWYLSSAHTHRTTHTQITCLHTCMYTVWAPALYFSLPLSLFNSHLSLSLFNVPRARHPPRPTRLQLLSSDNGVSYLLRCRGSRQLERILLYFVFGCAMKSDRYEH